MSFHQDFNLFIGGKTGILKGIQLNHEKEIIVKNMMSVKSLSASNEITVMTWGDENEGDILIGTKEQTVKIFDSEYKAFSTCIKAKLGKGPIVGVTRFNEVITSCSASGHIKCWKYSKESEVEINTNASCEKMEASGLNTGIVATGGRENDLKLWDLNTLDKVFVAKNVRPNELDLAIPIWVSDMKIIPQTDYKVVTSSRYGHVRLYDTKAQRRPVVEVTLPEQSLQCIELTHKDSQVVVGSGTGHMLLIDLRMGTSQNLRVVSSFKGATGSVRQIACHKSKPYIASVGLDSYFRLHNLETKKLLHEQFMQVKLNAVLMRQNFSFDPDPEVPLPAVPLPDASPNKATEEMNWMFDSLEQVGGKRARHAL